MVTEHSDLAAAGIFPRHAVPDKVIVRGKHLDLIYARAQARDVWDAGREDLVAQVWVPIHPAQQGRFPELHVLND